MDVSEAKNCRICMCELEDSNYFSVDLIGWEYMTYKEMFEKSLGYKILPNEDQQFCFMCARRLVKWEEFKLMCQKTQEIIAPVKDEEEELHSKTILNVESMVLEADSAQKGEPAYGMAPKDDQQVLLLSYPKEGKGRIHINTNDYACLAIDQYLNDVIIDFYIKYFMKERVTEEQRARTHVFSSFFYKILTTPQDTSLRYKTSRATDKDLKLKAAQKRYQRVSKWNKDVDLFKKDFIIIPICEESHWFLAIVCFPRLQGPVTAEAAGDESECDEAEGDDSELYSEDSGEEDMANPESPPIKQPCILIFDSLSGKSRSHVFDTLRDYLTCVYRAKNREFSSLFTLVFTKDNFPGHCPKVPQQKNFTDCGLYLLQYVEEFFANPIKDWRLPIKGLQYWFDALTVTKKREDISKLLEDLISVYEPSNLPLPPLEFPTKDGVLIVTDETPDFEEADTDPKETEEEGGNFTGVLTVTDETPDFEEADTDPKETEEEGDLSQQEAQNSSLSNLSALVNKANVPRRVKALFNFEGEKDELTLVEGDVLLVLDDTHPQWWKGKNQRGKKGRFPSNFVTADLSAVPETMHTNPQQQQTNVNLQQPQQPQLQLQGHTTINNYFHYNYYFSHPDPPQQNYTGVNNNHMNPNSRDNNKD